MTDDEKTTGCLLALVAILLVGLFGAIFFPSGTAMYHQGYRQGQIDHANGVIRWQLEKQDNGEVIWKTVEGGE